MMSPFASPRLINWKGTKRRSPMIKHHRVFIVFLCILVTMCFLSRPSWSAEGRMPVSECKPITASGSYIVTSDLSTTCGCIDIQANNVTLNLDGHTIVSNGTTQSCSVISTTNYTDITIKNGTIKGGGYGINLQNSVTQSDFNLLNLTIIESSYSAIKISGSSSCNTDAIYARAHIMNKKMRILSASFPGMFLSCIESSLLQFNTMIGGNGGILIDNSRNILIEKNTISQSGNAILISSSYYNKIKHNNVSANNGGIQLAGGSYNSVTGNDASGNSYCGIRLSGASSNLVTDNSATNNASYGICLDSSALNNFISSNQISDNGTFGMYFDTSTSGNVYRDNVSKGAPIQDDTCAPTCANTDGGGNFQ